MTDSRNPLPDALEHIAEGNLDVHFADGEIAALARDDDAATAIARMCSRYDLAPETVLEIAAELSGRFGVAENQSSELRKSRELVQRLAAGLAWWLQYSGDLRMAGRCLAFRLGFKDISGCTDGSAVSLAGACSTPGRLVKKATANKCILACEKALNIAGLPPLPPLPGQRSPGARQAMREARLKQLRIADCGLRNEEGDGNLTEGNEGNEGGRE